MQDLDIPDALKALYKTVWEIKQRKLVDMAADRGAFIDQSQSFNVHMSDPNFGKLTSLHFHAWKVGILARPRPACSPETAHPISTAGPCSRASEKTHEAGIIRLTFTEELWAVQDGMPSCLVRA